MVRIFIVYGKTKGEKIGKIIDDYFKVNGLNSFLASPKAHNIPRGVDFQPIIDQELGRTDIAIIIVTSGIRSSKEALNEIDQINRSKIPHIPYVEGNTSLPQSLQNKWKLSFKKNEGGFKKNLVQLELEMWRALDRTIASQLSQSEESTPVKPEPIPIGVIYT